MISRTILFTGFEPFGKWDINPTAVAAEYLNNMTYRDFTIVGVIIPLRLHEIQPMLVDLVKKYQPAAIIMSGQAGGDKIRLEQFAKNELRSRMPYNCGSVTNGEKIEENGEEILESVLPLQELLPVLLEHNIPTRMSDSAGLFGCNQIFYHCRHDFPEITAGFIHVPLLKEQVKDDKPWMSQEQITEALQLICFRSIDYIFESTR